jgi:uncharacterized protein YdaU (DUF1376 family)
MHYYTHNIPDFDKATRHLDRVERSIYRDLIEMYYDKEKPLTTDLTMLARKIIARSPEELNALKTVLDEFFVLTEQGYTNHRCDEEIAEYHRKATTARTNGAKGGRPRSPDPDASENPPADPAPTNQGGEPQPSGNPMATDIKTQSVSDGLANGTNLEPNGNPDETGLKANQELLTKNQLTKTTTTTSTTTREEKPLRVGTFEPREIIPPPEILHAIPGFDPAMFALQLRQSAIKLPDDESLAVEWARFRLSVIDGPPDEPRMWIKRFRSSLVHLQRSGRLGKETGGNNGTHRRSANTGGGNAKREIDWDAAEQRAAEQDAADHELAEEETE